MNKKLSSNALLLNAILLAFAAHFSGVARADEPIPPALPPKSDVNPNVPILPETLIVDGDNMSLQMDRKLTVEGNAVVQKSNQVIHGDKIDYDLTNEELHAIGHVKIVNQGMIVYGDELTTRAGETVGEIKNTNFEYFKDASRMPANRRENPYLMPTVGMTGATLMQQAQTTDTPIATDPSGKTVMSGPQVEYIRGNASTMSSPSETTRVFKDARYTTCAANRDDWYIKASQVRLDTYSESVTARNARLEFMGVPVLYTPWIDFSLNGERKTGLLTPTWGNSTRSGFQVYEPFYWNIAPNMDATIAGRYMSKRGVGVAGDFRYLGQNYAGIDSIEYLPNDSQTGTARWYGKFKHDQNLGNGLSYGFNYERVSDDNYFTDLTTRITNTSRINLPQFGYINYAFKGWNLNTLVQKYQTLDSTSYQYERMPQFTLTTNQDYLDQRINFDFNGQWTRFARNTQGPVVVEGNRLIATPTLSMPIMRSYGYVTPKIGAFYRSYSNLTNTAFTNAVGQADQYQSTGYTLPFFSLDSGLYFDRQMRVVKNSYTQTLEPRLYYVYIPYRDQSRYPVFDTAYADVNMGTLFRENQFVGGDRVNDANQITAALTTRMIDNSTGVQRLAATVGQRYYFADQRVTLPGLSARDRNTTDVVSALTARLLNRWNVDLGWQFNTDTGRTTRSGIMMRYNPEPGKTFNFGYRYFEDSFEQVNISAQWPLGGRWYGAARWNYSLRDKRPIESLLGVEYNAGCWVARTVLQQISTINSISNLYSSNVTPSSNYALYFQLELGGVASIGSDDTLYLLNRSIPGYVNTSTIRDNTRIQSYE